MSQAILNDFFMLAVPESQISRNGKGDKPDSYKIQYSGRVYEVLSLYETIDDISSDTMFFELKEKIGDEVILLHNVSGVVTRVEKNKKLTTRMKLHLERSANRQSSIDSMKGKLIAEGIDNALKLIDHTGIRLSKIGKVFNCEKEILILTGESSYFLKNSDLLALAELFEWNYIQDIKEKLKSLGVSNSLDVYKMDIDKDIMRKMGYSHWSMMFNTDFTRGGQSALKKKQAIILKMGWGVVEDVKSLLKTNYSVENSTDFFLKFSDAMYYDISGFIINEVLCIDDKTEDNKIKKGKVEKIERFSLEKKILFLEKLGWSVSKDVYDYLTKDKINVIQLHKAIGVRFAWFIEFFLDKLIDYDSKNGDLLSSTIAEYCICYNIIFRGVLIEQRRVEYIFAMFLLKAKFIQNKEGSITWSKKGISSFEQFATMANEEVIAQKNKYGLQKMQNIPTEFELEISRVPNESLLLDSKKALNELFAGDQYAIGVKKLFSLKGIGGIDLVKTNINTTLPKLLPVHWMKLLGYDLFTSTKTNDEKKKDILQALGRHLGEEVREYLKTKHGIGSSMEFFSKYNKNLLRDITLLLVNSVLPGDMKLLNDESFGIKKKITFLKNIGWDPNKETYDFLVSQKNSIEKLQKVFGIQFSVFIENQLDSIVKYDIENGDTLFDLVVNYCIRNNVYFQGFRIKSKDMSYILIMLILRIKYMKDEHGTAVWNKKGIHDFNRIASIANELLEFEKNKRGVKIRITDAKEKRRLAQKEVEPLLLNKKTSSLYELFGRDYAGSPKDWFSENAINNAIDVMKMNIRLITSKLLSAHRTMMPRYKMLTSKKTDDEKKDDLIAYLGLDIKKNTQEILKNTYGISNSIDFLAKYNEGLLSDLNPIIKKLLPIKDANKIDYLSMDRKMQFMTAIGWDVSKDMYDYLMKDKSNIDKLYNLFGNQFVAYIEKYLDNLVELDHKNSSKLFHKLVEYCFLFDLTFCGTHVKKREPEYAIIILLLGINNLRTKNNNIIWINNGIYGPKEMADMVNRLLQGEWKSRKLTKHAYDKYLQ